MSERTALRWCALAVVAGALLSAPGLASDFWLDEVWTWWKTQRLAGRLGVFTALHDSNNHHLNTLWVYALGGLFAGLAGVMQFGRLTVGDPTTAIGKELDVIAAVVIGGASLSGGEGEIRGAVLGALLMSFLANGCTLTGVPNYVQEILIGILIVAAVALDRWRHRRTV